MFNYSPKVITCISLLLFSICCAGQTQFYFNVTQGNFWMPDLRRLQNDIQLQAASAGLGLKITQSFPISPLYCLGVDRVVGAKKEYTLGGFLLGGVTKGIIGENTQYVTRFAGGVRGSKKLKKGFSVYSKLGFNFSLLQLNFEILQYATSPQIPQFTFYSYGVFLEPGASWQGSWKRLFIRGDLGYEVNIQGKSLYRENTDQYLLDRSGNKVIMDWSGFRLGVSAGLILGRMKPKTKN
jgi:hypothetical protein